MMIVMITYILGKEASSEGSIVELSVTDFRPLNLHAILCNYPFVVYTR